MGIIQRLKAVRFAFANSERILTSRDLERALTIGSSTNSGVTVSNDTAMRQATVYAVVNILSRSISQLPCHLYLQNGKNKDKAVDHPLYPLLHDQPNEWMTAPEFWGMAMAHLSLRGNFFALKNRGTSLNGPVRELIPFAADVVQSVEQNEQYKLVYKVRFPDSSLHDIPGNQIMHLRGITMNGFMGLNPIEYIRESIGLARATEEYGARYFGAGTHPGMIVEHPNKLSEAASKNLRASLAEAYSGLGKSHRLMLLEEGMKATNPAIKPEDSQFLETRKYQKSEIVDIFFGMPLTVLHSGDSTPTYASAEQFSLNYVIYALMPWLVGIEKSIRRDLISETDKKNHFAKFQVGGLLRGDFTSRMAGYQIGVNTEIFNPNECRDLEDLNPYEGGDEYRTRTSTVKEQSKDDSKDDSKDAGKGAKKDEA